MPRFSAFTPFGHLAFSGKPSHGESIYRTLRDNFGDVFSTDFNGPQQARLYAQAMCLAASQYTLDRALNNRNPLKATELLSALEHDYQVIPSPRATLNERRAFLAAYQKIGRGNRREAVEDAMRTLLGSDFIEYRTTLRADIVSKPNFPEVCGVFTGPGAKKKVFSFDVPVVPRSVDFITVPYTSLGGTEAPLVGETYCVDPDSRRVTIEQITISAVGPGTIGAVFTQAHDAGCIAVRPHPYWISNQRIGTIVVTLAAATDPETRRRIHELMGRITRSVSIWQIVQGSTAGFFTPDDPVLGLPDVNVLQ